MCDWNKYGDTRIDPCMRRLIEWFKSTDYEVKASCCGHNVYPMTIIVMFRTNGIANYYELLSGKVIPRTRRFYRRDKRGIYYIPEVSKEK